MKLAFITNLVNHHQIPLADEFYRLLGSDYKYISTEPVPDWLIKGGYDPNIDRQYIIRAYDNNESLNIAKDIANNADVVIIGSASESYVEQRIKDGKLTFRYTERWFKNRPWYLSGPRAWINYYKNHIRHRKKPLFVLAASAYTCRDVNDIGAYKNKVFKWGYFTRVDNFSLETSPKLDVSSVESTPQIMWCARFLHLKHPELPILLAKRLKDKGIKFHLNMFGSGEIYEPIRQLASNLKVNDVVTFCGNYPNDEILRQMRIHEIFLFTSDRNEGWGAVLNEAMSNGCAVVTSNLIGATPFLVEDGVNGLIFKSENIDDLERKVIYLLSNPDKRVEFARNAIFTMRNVWSPANAATQFLQLVDSIKAKNPQLMPKSGPCSLAERL